MTRLAIITAGVVTNVIEVDPDAVPNWCADWPDAGDHGPGDAWTESALAVLDVVTHGDDIGAGE